MCDTDCCAPNNNADAPSTESRAFVQFGRQVDALPKEVPTVVRVYNPHRLGQQLYVDVWLRGTHEHYAPHYLGFRLAATVLEDESGYAMSEIVTLCHVAHDLFDQHLATDDFFDKYGDTMDLFDAVKALADSLAAPNSMSANHAAMCEKRDAYVKHALHLELFLGDCEAFPLIDGADAWLCRDTTACVRGEKSWGDILRKEADGVFSLPLATPLFCRLLLEEIEHYNKWAADNNVKVPRPNSMNSYGVVLFYMGLSNLLWSLQQDVVVPLSRELFPMEATFGGGFTSLHAFHIAYGEKKDRGLDMHTDQSSVTVNLCLGKEFTGSTVTFCGVLAETDHRKHRVTYAHTPTRAVVHLGRLRHGADNIESGERHNIVLWSSNALLSASPFAVLAWQEEGSVDAVCTSYTHDKDYDLYHPYPPGTEQFKATAWCPYPAGTESHVHM
eukprot:PhM_4_TR11298/c0_g1_i1/m.93246